MAVTAGRVLLAAHKRNPELTSAFQEAHDAFSEQRRLGDRAIEHMTIVVIKSRVFGPSAEFAAEKDVPDARQIQLWLQGLSSEVRAVRRKRLRSGIDDDFDL